MSQKMIVLTFAATGHVLGAVTRAGQPETLPKPVDIVGDGLLVRDPDTGQLEIHVAPERLSSVLVDRADHVLVNPKTYAIENGLVEEQPALPADPLTLDGTSIDIDVGAAVSEDTDVWVQIESDALLNPLIRLLQIPESDQKVSEALTLPAGDYSALVMIPSFRTEIRKKTIT